MDSLDAMYKEDEARLHKEAMAHPYGQCRIGKYWISLDVLAQKGLRKIEADLGLKRRYPVKNEFIIAKAVSPTDTVSRWLSRNEV